MDFLVFRPTELLSEVTITFIASATPASRSETKHLFHDPYLDVTPDSGSTGVDFLVFRPTELLSEVTITFIASAASSGFLTHRGQRWTKF